MRTHFKRMRTNANGKIDIDRRRLITSLVALGLSPTLLAGLPNNTAVRREYWVSAQGMTEGSYSLSWMNSRSDVSASAVSGFRGHGAVQHPLKQASVLMFARRPGSMGIEVNLMAGSIDATFHCGAERRLMGHGCFSADGKTLFTSEAKYKTGAGKIGIRDALTYQQIGEYDSCGIEPHEIKLMPDGKTLVIANSGIFTNHDTGQEDLNLDSMLSTLTYLDVASGRKLDEYKVPETKASIRHLDVAPDGTVALAMQVQRLVMGHNNTVPLGAVHKPGQPIALLTDQEPIILQMKDYVGSVAINSRARVAGFTSPRGNVAAFWNIDDLTCVGYHQLQDVCGIAVTSDQQDFLITNSFGELRHLNARTLKENPSKRLRLSSTHWDNHLLVAKII